MDSNSTTEAPKDNTKNKKFKRVRKGGNRFLSNAKGFGKKGNYGRGTHIEEDQFTYFIGILEALRAPAESTDERVSMCSNVLEQTKDKEIHFASNQVVSKTIEALIGYAEEDHLETFFDAFGENFRPICSDPYASHVLQKMIEIAFLRAMAKHKIEEKNKDSKVIPLKKFKPNSVTDLKHNLDTKFSKSHRDKCSAFVERISKFLLNNLEDFVWDIFGSHLIRACIMSLAGVHVPKVIFEKGKPGDKDTPQKAESRQTLFHTPEEWHELLKEFPSRLKMWPQFPELAYNDLSSALLGVICVALSHIDKNALKAFGKKILKQAFLNVEIGEKSAKTEQQEEDGSDEDKNSKSPSVFTAESSVRLLETLISVAGPKLFHEIYNTLFDGRIVELAKEKRTNYPVKKILLHIKDKPLFENIFEESVVHIDSFLKADNCGILIALSSACLRLNKKQAAFITALQGTLHCTTAYGADRPKSFLTCLLKLKPFEDIANDKNNNSLHGSLIVQDILQFNKPIFLVNSILEASPKDLVDLIEAPHGSHIADAFLKSKFIGEKSREKFIKQLEGFYMDLALTRFGSRVLENIFEVANETQRVRIAKELTTKENKLKGTMFGRIIFNTLRLETFKLSPEQWKTSWKAKVKKEDILGEIVKKKKRTAASTD